jgi:hypothetical protein
MGMYTEFYADIPVRNEDYTGIERVINYLIDPWDMQEDGYATSFLALENPPDHPFFSCWAFQKVLIDWTDAFKEETRIEVINGLTYIRVRADSKCSSGTVLAFCDWIGPHIALPTGVEFGYVKYEEWYNNHLLLVRAGSRNPNADNDPDRWFCA